MANKEHLDILKQGVKVWEEWRDKNFEIQPNLVKADLEGAELRKADLSFANLSGADLRRANLREAILTWADLSRADLRSANLSGAVLGETNLAKATLKNVDLSRSHLRGADLAEADLRRADLSSADLPNVTLKKANLKRANLSQAHLIKADLGESDLDKANLAGALLIQTNLSNATITGACFYGTSRDDWIIDGVKCDYVYWDKLGLERVPKDRDFCPGEFEELYKQLPTFEYYFEQGFSPLDPLIMDRVVQAINEQHPEIELKLDSFHSRGQAHAVFTVLHKEAIEEAKQQVTNDYERRLAALEGQQQQLLKLFSKLSNNPQPQLISGCEQVIIGGNIQGDNIQKTARRDYLEHVEGSDVTTGNSLRNRASSMANEEHLQILQQGVEVWNEWRAESFDIKIGLHKVVLKMNRLHDEKNWGEISQSKTDLNETNWSKIDLSGVNLSRADLHGVNLSGANLTGVNLSGANLRGADLQEANLTKVNLSKAILSGANLRKADLSGAYMSETIMNGVNLRKANLRKANLSGGGLLVVDPNMSILPRKTRRDIGNLNEMLQGEMDLNEADLSEADLSGVDLREATLCGVNLSGANLSGADLSGTNLNEANLYNAILNGANMTKSLMDRANLRETSLYEANLNGATISEAYLSTANLNGANLNRADLSRATLRGAKLCKATLHGATLRGADLNGADLNGADLGDATLVQANFYHATLTGAFLYGTGRNNWTIDGIQCDFVYWDEKPLFTRWNKKEEKQWEQDYRIPKDRDFHLGEFEELYKQLPTFEYYFEQGFTPLDPIVMDDIVQTLNERHPEFHLDLTGFDKRGTPHATFTTSQKEFIEVLIEQIASEYNNRMNILDGQKEVLMELFSRTMSRGVSVEKLEGNFILNQAGNDIVSGNKEQRSISAGRDYLEHVEDSDVTTGNSQEKGE